MQTYAGFLSCPHQHAETHNGNRKKTLQEHSSMLTRVLDVLGVQDDTGPLLEEAVATIEELMELDGKLQNKDFAKKMVS